MVKQSCLKGETEHWGAEVLWIPKKRLEPVAACTLLYTHKALEENSTPKWKLALSTKEWSSSSFTGGQGRAQHLHCVGCDK